MALKAKDIYNLNPFQKKFAHPCTNGTSDAVSEPVSSSEQTGLTLNED